MAHVTTLARLPEKEILAALSSVAELLRDGAPSLGELGVTKPAGPYALYYHQAEVVTRERDLRLIVRRLFAGRRRHDRARKRLDAHRPFDIPRGMAWPAPVARASVRVSTVLDEMRLDFETFFMVGAVLLDQWSYLVARLAGLTKPLECSFFPLAEERIEELKGPPVVVALRPFLPALRWLSFWFRHFRNDFIVHIKEPTQRSHISGGGGSDIQLFMPRAVGLRDDAMVEAAIRKLTRFAPEHLRKAPADYWEKARPRRLLERIIENVGTVAKRGDRNAIAHAAKLAGVTSPPSHLLTSVLARTLADATDAALREARTHPSLVDLGVIRRASPLA